MTPTNPLDFAAMEAAANRAIELYGSDEAGTAAGFVVPATVRQTFPTWSNT